MGWEGQQAGGSPGLNAGRGSRECPWAALGVQALPGAATLLPGFTAYCGHPLHGPLPCPQSRFALPSTPVSLMRLALQVSSLRHCCSVAGFPCSTEKSTASAALLRSRREF